MFDDISKLIKEIKQISDHKNIVMVGIDGRSGSGKTMLANRIHERCNDSIVFHMDDYRKPIRKRNDDWKAKPIHDMDIDRMKRELILPAFQGKNMVYRNYDEKEDTYIDMYKVIPHHIYIVEGTYALCPDLYPYYDCTIFCTCSPESQKKRLKPKLKASYSSFLSIYAPLEEEYFYQYKTAKHAQYYFDTTDIE